MPLSLVIRGGTVCDGSGASPMTADVAIDGDRIVGVGSVPDHVPAPVLDASGLAVAPGFINVLSHAWASLQVDPTAPSDVLQGVTTEVFGEAFSLGPTNAQMLELAGAFGLPPEATIDFARLSDGLGALEKQGVAPNVASFIGGHNLRILAAGFDDRRLTAEELDRSRGIVAEEMQDGALGIGTALIYAPGFFADTDELAALCEVVASHDGLYISHLRSEGERFLECLDELVQIARRAHVRAEVYHLKAAGSANWPKMRQAIDAIEEARSSGLEVAANMYPYTAGSTSLGASIPPVYHAGGPQALADRLGDPEERKRIAADVARTSPKWENLYLMSGGGEGVLVLGSKVQPDIAGRFLSDLARERGEDEVETLLSLVASDPTILVAYFIISEENVRLGLQQAWVSVGSDSEAAAPVAPWTERSTHPRTYGTFARVLGRYARDEGLLPISEAVRRMTSLPAERFRLRDRGRIAEGAFADVAIFDPAAVRDLATYDEPHRFAEGMRHVLVNGQTVVSDGRITGALPGRRLRRGL